MFSSAVHAVGEFVAGIPDPAPDAPQAIKDGVSRALSLVKYISLACIAGIIVSAGVMVVAGDRGYGGGMSPELKSKIGMAIIALILVASSSQIIEFFS